MYVTPLVYWYVCTEPIDYRYQVYSHMQPQLQRQIETAVELQKQLLHMQNVLTDGELTLLPPLNHIT